MRHRYVEPSSTSNKGLKVHHEQLLAAFGKSIQQQALAVAQRHKLQLLNLGSKKATRGREGWWVTDSVHTFNEYCSSPVLFDLQVVTCGVQQVPDALTVNLNNRQTNLHR